MPKLYFILIASLYSSLNVPRVYAHGPAEKTETAKAIPEANIEREQPLEPPIENRISDLLGEAAADFDPKKIKAAIEAMELPNGEGIAESKELLKKLAELDTSKLEGLAEKINIPEMKKFVKALTEMRKLSKDELLSKVFGTKDFKGAEARAIAQEFYKRLKEDPNMRVGFVASPQNIDDLKKRMTGFLNSEEGKKFIVDLKEKLPGLISSRAKILKGVSKESKPEDPYQKLSQAVNEWDKKNGGKLQEMGLNGKKMAETLKKIKEEIGVKELTVGVFLPDAALKNAMHSLITEDLMPQFKKEIRTFAAKKAAEEVSKEVAKHPILAGIFRGKVAQAYGEAQSGAAEGAQDAATGEKQKKPSGGKTYNQAYTMAYSQTQKKIKEVELNLQKGLDNSLGTILTPSQKDSGITVNIIRSGPPAAGDFEKDPNYPGYASKPYFSLYEKKVLPDGSVKRETNAGWYANAIDARSKSLDEIVTNGDLGRWATDFLKNKK